MGSQIVQQNIRNFELMLSSGVAGADLRRAMELWLEYCRNSLNEAPAVTLVHSDAAFIAKTAAALRWFGYRTAVFQRSMDALASVEAANSLDLLVTGIDLPRLNGLALARIARLKRPDVRVLFLAPPDARPHTDGIGLLMPFPVRVPALVMRIAMLLGEPPCQPTPTPAAPRELSRGYGALLAPATGPRQGRDPAAPRDGRAREAAQRPDLPAVPAVS